MLHFQRFPTRPAVKAHLIVNCIVVALMIIVVCLRVWSRIYLKAGLGWDDGIIIFAVVSLLYCQHLANRDANLLCQSP